MQQHLTLWTCHKTVTPKLDTRSDSRWVWLISRSIHDHHIATMRHGMSALHQHPRTRLTHLLGWCITLIPPYGGRIYNDLRAIQSHKSCSLRIPLVPAHHHPQTSYRGLYGMKAQVTWRKIEFFIIGRVIRNVHFSINASYGAI